MHPTQLKPKGEEGAKNLGNPWSPWCPMRVCGQAACKPVFGSAYAYSRGGTVPTQAGERSTSQVFLSTERRGRRHSSRSGSGNSTQKGNQNQTTPNHRPGSRRPPTHADQSTPP